ncbi:MAG: tRNA adenosine(34) deaminase TadA [Ignavibacteriaceae bacterium]
MNYSEQTYRFMYAALQEAEKALVEDEVPVGAVVIKNNKIIGRGYNQVERLKDATAHAEMIAITAAANHLDNWRLEGCSLYVTLEPCVMCTGAMLASRINELYFATNDTKYGACGSLYNLAEDGKTNHKLKVYSGIYTEESQRLLTQFFASIRNSSIKGNA